MILKKLRLNTDEKGFTLIELMIVIAIIGILAAIAIPNFISYRDKTYCSAAESDTLSVMGAISDYFSNPLNVTVSAPSIQAAPTNFPVTLSNGNAYLITPQGANGYRVSTTDITGRCPRFTSYGKTL